MSYITYLAREEDGEEILEILESSPAKGSIELLYTRRPNAYVSYKKESKEEFVQCDYIREFFSAVQECADEFWRMEGGM